MAGKPDGPPSRSIPVGRRRDLPTTVQRPTGSPAGPAGRPRPGRRRPLPPPGVGAIVRAMTDPIQIRLTGHIDVPDDRLAAVTAALPEHIRLTRAEAGCLAFEVMPVAGRPGRFVVHELFASRAAFEAHQARIAASDWGRVSAGIPRDYVIEEVAS